MITLEGDMETTMVGIRDAKINLSKLLKQVQDGNEILITDRGRPVGKIVPVLPHSLALKERLKRLEERGAIERCSRKRMSKVPPPLPVEEGLAQKILQEDRNYEI
jgi:prevent-host-death family protein